MAINRRELLAAGAAIGMGFAVTGVLAQDDEGGPRGRSGGSPSAREVWAAKPVPPTPYVAPNRLIWRLSDVLTTHNGQQDWTQHVVRTRDYDAYWISMGRAKRPRPSSMRTIA